jgi:hypothetical protein
MTYQECENAYDKWKHFISGQIFIDGIWEDITDIEEDAHRSWICKTSKTTIELSDIQFCHIQFPTLI